MLGRSRGREREQKDQQGGLEHRNHRALGVLGDHQRGGAKAEGAARKRHGGAVGDRIYPTLRRGEKRSIKG